ncbi:hypothetical protein [Swaminathania salitolerans]|uniref:Uncharacterized protein n=1 Tax=Swaminathania salitolerans TaxID=182838 RepID=A0A511BTB5_9PROT|nr:hypothetical protein [Swaminathania salitolerans]GBQ12284.1 hypothetical protein AA21291_1135 [Swaminathania salitolerans LMG 21291]GEL02794.1 hypothetical protein SSA02_19570 [Swaminathania salitolerans]
MIRYLSTGAADLARLLAQSHAPRPETSRSLSPPPSLLWAEALLFFGFEGGEFAHEGHGVDGFGVEKYGAGGDGCDLSGKRPR